MKTAPVSELKSRLSQYLDRVKAGEEVLITDRGTPIARLSPISPSKSRRGAMAGLERSGLINLGSGKISKAYWGIPTPKDPGGSVLKALLEEREKGR